MDVAPPLRVDPEALDLQQVPVLSIDQIRAIRASNDYVERPVALEPATQSGLFFVTAERHGRPIPRSQSLHHHAHLAQVSQSSTLSSLLSRSSTASDQRLLALPSRSRLGPSRSCQLPIRSQPKPELKGDLALGKRLAEAGEAGRHLLICEHCGRCKCQECGTFRKLPSCWLCDGRCVCSAQSAVESVTCLCVVKGLFYHCSAGEGDAGDGGCSDRPCSCSPAHRAARWVAMATLSLCLPCLCCYPPARLCLSACEGAYDRATRPGCRCRNTNVVCRKISSSNSASFPKSLEKPV